MQECETRGISHPRTETDGHLRARPPNKPVAASGPGGRWGSVVFGWRAPRPPRVVFCFRLCVSSNKFSHFRQKAPWSQHVRFGSVVTLLERQLYGRYRTIYQSNRRTNIYPTNARSTAQRRHCPALGIIKVDFSHEPCRSSCTGRLPRYIPHPFQNCHDGHPSAVDGHAVACHR